MTRSRNILSGLLELIRLGVVLALISPLWACSMFRGEAAPVAFDHGYTAWSATLSRVATPEGVRYDLLAEAPEDLDAILAEFAATGSGDYARFTRDERLCALINAHNALGMKRGLERFESGAVERFWRWIGPETEIEFAGRDWTLKDLRKEIMSGRFDEARAAFALNGGERGCPPLAPVPYTPANLDAALERQTKLFLRDPDFNQFDAEKRVFIASPRLKENRKAIERQYTSINSFIRRFSEIELVEEMEKYPPRIVYRRQDRRLNSTEAPGKEA